jgi:prephenate dehydrogenase
VAALDQLTLLAPGLLGGSVARAARAAGLARRIVLWARRPETRAALRAQPWCDAAPDTPEEATAGASLVVIASPVDQIATLAARIRPALPAGALVTDVGSVKAEVCRAAAAALGDRAVFVGAHPMAGSEKTGWEHSRADLFQGRACFVTPLPATPAAAVEKVASFWRALGCRVTAVPPAEHDRIVAHISHLPQLAASALCAALAGRDPGWREFAGGGLRDTTRIAGSDPELWRTILAQNRPEVLAALDTYLGELQGLRAALAGGDLAAVTAVLERGRAYRAGVPPAP